MTGYPKYYGKPELNLPLSAIFVLSTVIKLVKNYIVWFIYYLFLLFKGNASAYEVDSKVVVTTPSTTTSDKKDVEDSPVAADESVHKDFEDFEDEDEEEGKYSLHFWCQRFSGNKKWFV